MAEATENNVRYYACPKCGVEWAFYSLVPKLVASWAIPQRCGSCDEESTLGQWFTQEPRVDA